MSWWRRLRTAIRAWRTHRSRRPSPIRTVVRDLILQTDRLPASGEYKRHVVYAELLTRYHPQRSKRHLAWLIEDVLREMYDDE